MAQELADQLQDDAAGVVTEAAPIGDAAPADAGIEKPEKPPSLRQTLEKSIETVREAEAKADKAGRLHDKDGKFAPKERTVEAPEKDAPVKEVSETKKDAQPEASKAIGPPPGWSPESKAAFEALPPSVKADVLKRENEISTGFKQKSDELKRYQDIEQVLAPTRAIYQQHGVRSDAEAISRLFQWEKMIRDNPAQAIPQLARQYGVNLQQLAQSPEPSAAQEIPAQLRPVIDGFGNLTQQVNAIQTDLQRQRQDEVARKIADFSKDKPHFDKVKVRMGQLMVGGSVPSDDLDAAYQMAIWADPEIRAVLQKEQTDKMNADLAKQNTARAQSARHAAISPGTRAPNGAAVAGKEKSKGVRGNLMAAIRELQEDRA